MTVLLYILGVIAALVVLLLLIAWVSKKGYSVSRETIIHSPAPEVFSYIRRLKNQDHYSKFNMMDPNIKKTFKGVDGEEGFIYAWDGNKRAGQGEQEIKKISEDEKVDTEVRFIKPFSGVASASMSVAPLNDGSTKVRWVFASKMKYPMNIMLLFMNFEKLLGRDLDESLANLKRNLES